MRYFAELVQEMHEIIFGNEAVCGILLTYDPQRCDVVFILRALNRPIVRTNHLRHEGECSPTDH